jgi:hypothetical protein
MHSITRICSVCVGVSKAWESLVAGEDLANFVEIDLMPQPWKAGQADKYVDAPSAR